MGRLSPGPRWTRRHALLAARVPLVAISSSKLTPGRLAGRRAPDAAPRALQDLGRTAAVQDGGEGVVTDTARVRYWDARPERLVKGVYHPLHELVPRRPSRCDPTRAPCERSHADGSRLDAGQLRRDYACSVSDAHALNQRGTPGRLESDRECRRQSRRASALSARR